MAEKVSLNVRMPGSLHQGLVELARQEHRSLNDQIIYSLSQSVLEQLPPKRDELHVVLAKLAQVIQPYVEFWKQKYAPLLIDIQDPPVERVYDNGTLTLEQREHMAKMAVINDHLERVLVEFAQVYALQEQIRNALLKRELPSKNNPEQT